ncbi:hypothetical protein SUGI_0024870 [Cryptomeria japonica]|nr:hypothetical protein SUGI_0024870 [Cryptomeria japonica]
MGGGQSVEMVEREASSCGGDYLPISAEVENGKVQGKPMKRLPPRRGDVKRQIFASMGRSLAELVRSLKERGQDLSKLIYNQIVVLLSKMSRSKTNPMTASQVEAENILKLTDIQNL